MNDLEIKRALEWCAYKSTCTGCPYSGRSCRVNILKDALDLINRQYFEIHQLEKQVSEIQNANLIDFNATVGNYKAENKDLKAEVERLKKKNKNYAELEQGCYVTGYKNIKAEAYKECIEKAKNKILPMLTTATLEEKETICFCLNKLDNLLNELVGDGDGK